MSTSDKVLLMLSGDSEDYRPTGTMVIRTGAMRLGLLLLCAVMLQQPSLAVADAPTAWPKVDRETRPWTRWWWMGSIATKEDLTREMEKYAAAGIGGLEITPIYGVRGHEADFTPYLSPTWMELLVHTLKEAERLDLGIDMATGNGWPFGGPWVSADTACRNLVIETYEVAEGESLGHAIVYEQPPMLRRIGSRMHITEIKEPVSDNTNLQELALEQVRFAKQLPLQAVMAFSRGAQPQDLTQLVDGRGILNWRAPQQDWTLYAVFQGWHGKMVERAGPGGEGNVIDHFDKNALSAYLGRFDEAFKGHDITTLRAFFNDSYEVDDATGESNWTARLLDQFQLRRGYDLLEHLPALTSKTDSNESRRIQCDFRETISDLLLDEFTTPWHQWSQRHHATTRNQAHGSPANILDLYAASGIPETEGTEVLGMKTASSAASVMGKRLCSAEAATWLDEHFRGSLAEVKQNCDSYFLGGVNHICYHGTTFSPESEPWPGWLFYAAVHFGPTNSWWPHLSQINQYVTRCQSFLQNGTPDNDVLVYYPIYDFWSNASGGTMPHFSAQDGAMGIGRTLLSRGYTFDLVSDRQLAESRFVDNRVRTTGNEYRIVFVPKCNRMPVATLRLLHGLAEQGATVVFESSIPSDVPGWHEFDKRKKRLKEIVQSTGFRLPGPGSANIGKGQWIVAENVEDALREAGVRAESMVDRRLNFARRRHENGIDYFIVNRGQVEFADFVPLTAGGESVVLFDPMTGGVVRAWVRRESKSLSVFLQLAPEQSCVVRILSDTIDQPAVAEFPYWDWPQELKPLTSDWSVHFGSDPTDMTKIRLAKLCSWTEMDDPEIQSFSGVAHYRTAFPRPPSDAAYWVLDLGDVKESARVRLNGRLIATLVQPPFHVVVKSAELNETNDLEVAVANLMANRIRKIEASGANWKRFYNVNFPAKNRQNRGADGLFTSSHWEPAASGLLGPVTLTPVEPMRDVSKTQN